MAKWIYKAVLLVFITLLFTGCKGENMNRAKFVQSKEVNLSQQKLQNLASKKIYFGHQSVGFNIIEGIKDILNMNPGIKFNLKETRDPRDFDAPVFAHSGIGRNKEPISKIDDFKKLMESGVGDKVDIAFFKFCFVDIDRKTDFKNLFDSYSNIMQYLVLKYPEVKFIHVTVPLMSVNIGWKTKIKKLLGKRIEIEEDNIQRNLFNAMIVLKYGKLVFNLAKFESIDSYGNEKLFQGRGEKFNYLLPEYAYEGGHLNSEGRKVIASRLLNFLANISNNN